MQCATSDKAGNGGDGFQSKNMMIGKIDIKTFNGIILTSKLEQ
jgi:hypothetical protein